MTATIKPACPLVAQRRPLSTSFSCPTFMPNLLSTAYPHLLFRPGFFSLRPSFFAICFCEPAQRILQDDPRTTLLRIITTAARRSCHLHFLPQDKLARLGLAGSPGSVSCSSPGYNDSCPSCVTSGQYARIHQHSRPRRGPVSI